MAYNDVTGCIYYTCVDNIDFDCEIVSCGPCLELNTTSCQCEEKPTTPCTECINGIISDIECPTGYICNNGDCIPNAAFDQLNDIIHVDYSIDS